MDMERYRITHTEEYRDYLRALCRMASRWVPEIRLQYARKAYEMYANETVRRIVLEYGKEAVKLDADRLFYFELASENEDSDEVSVRDSCLNQAEHYAQTIFMLFDIKLSGEEKQ